MPFTPQEKDKLLATPYVGGKVIERLEAIGIDSFEKLKASDVSSITATVADMLQTTCWKNSPQAKKAIQNAIKTAQSDRTLILQSPPYSYCGSLQRHDIVSRDYK